MRSCNTLLLLASLFLFAACEKETQLEPLDRGTLVHIELKGTLSVSEVIGSVDELDITDIAEFDVSYYTLTYRTELQGKPYNASGLLMVPEGLDSMDLICYFHGTQLPLKILDAYDAADETPSLYDGGTENFREIRNMGLSWATAGYAVFMPDYVGFGHTDDTEHPYLNYPAMFHANIDGLLAVKTLFASISLEYDNRLFLAGWSQGGGACLSAHRYIQESYSDEFEVVASSGLAGPYHFNRFVDEILSNKEEELNIINIFSWAFYALNKYSDVARPTDQLYAYPVYDQFSAIFPPSKKPAEVFNDYFLAQIIDGRDTTFRALMDANTFSSGWTPQGKVFFHHGDADDVVYYFNSVDAQTGLTQAGADVTLYTYPGGKHDTELDNYISRTLIDFNTLK